MKMIRSDFCHEIIWREKIECLFGAIKSWRK